MSSEYPEHSEDPPDPRRWERHPYFLRQGWGSRRQPLVLPVPTFAALQQTVARRSPDAEDAEPPLETHLIVASDTGPWHFLAHPAESGQSLAIERATIALGGLGCACAYFARWLRAAIRETDLANDPASDGWLGQRLSRSSWIGLAARQLQDALPLPSRARWNQLADRPPPAPLQTPLRLLLAFAVLRQLYRLRRRQLQSHRGLLNRFGFGRQPSLVQLEEQQEDTLTSYQRLLRARAQLRRRLEQCQQELERELLEASETAGASAAAEHESRSWYDELYQPALFASDLRAELASRWLSAAWKQSQGFERLLEEIAWSIEQAERDLKDAPSLGGAASTRLLRLDDPTRLPGHLPSHLPGASAATSPARDGTDRAGRADGAGGTAVTCQITFDLAVAASMEQQSISALLRSPEGATIARLLSQLRTPVGQSSRLEALLNLPGHQRHALHDPVAPLLIGEYSAQLTLGITPLPGTSRRSLLARLDLKTSSLGPMRVHSWGLDRLRLIRPMRWQSVPQLAVDATGNPAEMLCLLNDWATIQLLRRDPATAAEQADLIQRASTIISAYAQILEREAQEARWADESRRPRDSIGASPSPIPSPSWGASAEYLRHLQRPALAMVILLDDRWTHWRNSRGESPTQWLRLFWKATRPYDRDRLARIVEQLRKPPCPFLDLCLGEIDPMGLSAFRPPRYPVVRLGLAIDHARVARWPRAWRVLLDDACGVLHEYATNGRFFAFSSESLKPARRPLDRPAWRLFLLLPPCDYQEEAPEHNEKQE